MGHFSFSRYCFTIKAKSDLELPPFKGSTLRGGLGYALKKIACVANEKSCDDCLLKEKCVYSYIFETRPPRDSSFKQKYLFAPHPFIILPPLATKTCYKTGEYLSFELVLIGKAIEYLPYIVYAFHMLGEMGLGKGKGNYELIKVDEINKDGDKICIFDSNKNNLTGPSQFITLNDFANNIEEDIHQIKFLFLTPVRLKEKGDLAVEINFSLFVERLITRIELLSRFHCGGNGIKGRDDLLRYAKRIKTTYKSLRWKDWERYSQRQDTRMKLGGLIGSITFEGELDPFIPYLKVGQFIHVGLGTSFGLGRYEILSLR
ncbi:MAG: CRISPR-associated protein Cas6 [Deltaproteobacteria bacterium]|nr:MAG: CRISPR-associated protein Cas6 [Deltaproteobacteria bacterium]